ncbi:putative disease resistance protein RGA1 isoform X1 [Macadamia integrifolia]|uniref:putative disease resistance protein RGA1 isoform X1 n=1 Tax=Macadamia integrifolia TaxID=60698 RepID=UPI001C4F1E6F|nr:putative disease resistance protein RGA1 isoform X1 [Macadamia integrifolia]XP_042508828.1 putative disease resistance protein RGA1 isoform X1 [Macadamia integrifolia]XP_042508829.1 putative disease resistance protein RGA1 isoform X1 [Macadamia integrifolia]XP_042508830.1 putative disease resistance protein RGA1 isoform X1 [Macadamia integrifolia]XP_042508831.1 putative disease resistance protein RGA1 isoform X1 [Macadamia integrifolia]XP_042508832.1 putative disease resistance protein RGA1
MYDVLEGLEPHSNLKKFSMEQFHGLKCPTWMASGLSAFKNLIFFKLEWCPRLEYVPTLGELPLLSFLHLYFIRVKCLGWEFYSSSNSTGSTSSGTVAFPSLKKLKLFDMPDLVEWLEVLPNFFPSLEKLSINYCPKLKIMPSRFPSLKSLHFYETNEMALSSLSCKLNSLNHLRITACPDLKSVPERLLQNNAHVLQKVKISHCQKLETIFRSEGREGYPIPLVFPSLQSLEIEKCPSVKPLLDIQGMTSLQKLELKDFAELKSLPEGLQQLTMLESLRMGRFPEGMDYIKGEEDLQHPVSLRCRRLIGWPQHKNLRDQLKHLTKLT